MKTCLIIKYRQTDGFYLFPFVSDTPEQGDVPWVQETLRASIEEKTARTYSKLLGSPIIPGDRVDFVFVRTFTPSLAPRGPEFRETL